jgi:hypothetical protein
VNLSKTIIPKSDQLNADDLIAGPITIKITDVRAGSTEQPVVIHYAGDNGRPYKPGKSMRRVLVSIWGLEGSAYIGRSLSLYRDPDIKFGSDLVGGIRISHASDITKPLSIPLTETRGRRKIFRVEPLVVKPDEDAPDIQALTDVGQSKAKEGTKALQSWWVTLPTAAKHALKASLVEWKQTAEAVDTTKGGTA